MHKKGIKKNLNKKDEWNLWISKQKINKVNLVVMKSLRTSKFTLGAIANSTGGKVAFFKGILYCMNFV